MPNLDLTRIELTCRRQPDRASSHHPASKPEPRRPRGGFESHASTCIALTNFNLTSPKRPGRNQTCHSATFRNGPCQSASRSLRVDRSPCLTRERFYKPTNPDADWPGHATTQRTSPCPEIIHPTPPASIGNRACTGVVETCHDQSDLDATELASTSQARTCLTPPDTSHHDRVDRPPCPHDGGFRNTARHNQHQPDRHQPNVPRHIPCHSATLAAARSLTERVVVLPRPASTKLNTHRLTKP